MLRRKRTKEYCLRSRWKFHCWLYLNFKCKGPGQKVYGALRLQDRQPWETQTSLDSKPELKFHDYVQVMMMCACVHTYKYVHTQHHNLYVKNRVAQKVVSPIYPLCNNEKIVYSTLDI